MSDYERYYNSYFEIFTREKESREDLWYASCYCGKLLASFLRNILIKNYDSESEKFEQIKALNDAYQKTFPPDEA
ncbi:hypothetical protein P40081_28640 [Paenibacillus sp. FSL P4-0081]|uniref:hypothetical protein n=1 Tax=Paenibacillus sp. FSL P4-0081 TaxID=1536769 RepID=UPI0004F6A3B7|nr:hypothetical protein [Paenibacillus sp. FSL P4-0081]AIQ26939.1 hypothetical protein P40081_00985 [Paenibacillus sp. FSL P4-0081]AIQ31659.1 hypothetical protein P40081_28640 [Paenibacillus sp. FSL P4-0081]